MAKVELAWRASGDQIAHAHTKEGRKHARLTLCGIKVIDERFAWPSVVRCPDCDRLTAKAAA